MNANVDRLTEFKEHHWDLLLDYIGQGRVVPVLGPELLVATKDGASVPFYSAVAERLARYFGMEGDGGAPMTLNEVLIRFRRENNGPDQVARVGLNKILKEMEGEPQPLLRKLVDLNRFGLFLTTTPDSMLANALASSGADPEVYFFSNNFPGRIDLPQKELERNRRVVYHLYGKAHPFVHYAISEDDRLDYSCRWMDSASKPKNLLSYLSRKYLLILGCGYENWLARFFLFGLKGTELFSNIWDASGLLADSQTPNDRQLDRFMSRCHGNIYYEGGVAEFVDQLVRRMGQLPVPMGRDEDVYVPQSIFISYASENRAVALRIKKRLESANLPVWLDRSQLESGDGYDEKIRNNIRGAAFFLPLLSHVTVDVREPRYFRVEWSVAEEESRRRSPMLPFVHPVAIDDVRPCDSLPDSLNQRHWMSAPGGELSDEDLGRIVDLFARL